MKFFKFLIMQSPLLKSLLDYHCVGEVSLNTETDLEKHQAPITEPAPGSTGPLTDRPNTTQVGH